MKRILIYAMVVLLLVPLMVFPVSASEQYCFYPSDICFFCSEFVPDGMYTATFQFKDNFSSSFEVIEPFIISYVDTIDGPYSEVLVRVRVDDDGSFYELELNLAFGFVFGSLGMVFLDEDFTNEALSAFDSITLIPIESPKNKTFLSSVTDGLTTSIRWCGSVISSLVSGELSPLLPLMAISVSIAALFLGCKVIKKYTWGA